MKNSEAKSTNFNDSSNGSIGISPVVYAQLRFMQIELESLFKDIEIASKEGKGGIANYEAFKGEELTEWKNRFFRRALIELNYHISTNSTDDKIDIVWDKTMPVIEHFDLVKTFIDNK